MAIIDNKTSNMGLPLPHEDNALEDDVKRIREAFTIIDDLDDGTDYAQYFLTKLVDYDARNGNPTTAVSENAEADDDVDADIE